MDYTYLLATLAAFLAGFVDAVVGGGGLVQVPALFILFPGFTVPNVIATNRFASFMGTSVAAFQYTKKVKVDWSAVLFAGLGAGFCSFAGSNLAHFISSDILKPVVLFLMIVMAIFTYSKKDLGLEQKLKYTGKQLRWASFLIGCLAGFYNGLIGPGTGSLLVFAFVSIVGFGFLAGSAKAKYINVVADIFSLIVFIYHGAVVYSLALPMMAANMAGSYLGSRMAMVRGNAFVRRFFIGIIVLLILRMTYDIFKN